MDHITKHASQHATPEGQQAFTKTFHSFTGRGHSQETATRLGHLAAGRVEKPTTALPKPLAVAFKKKGK